MPRRVRDRRRASIITGTPVDVDGLAGDEPGAVADQEQAGRGDLIDLPLPPERDAGSVRRTIAYHSGLSRRVSMLPGETTFTRMLCGANSEASPRAKPTSAILAAER